MLNGHLDTVSLTSYDGDPLDPVIECRLHGRGSYDMKAGIAALMVAAARDSVAEVAVVVAPVRTLVGRLASSVRGP
jgi:acetylornithine deacetylase/succinyl-diaminopimelate desuccinylase-like protein